MRRPRQRKSSPHGTCATTESNRAGATKALGQKSPGKFENLFIPLGSATKVNNNVVSVRTESSSTPVTVKGKLKK